MTNKLSTSPYLCMSVMSTPLCMTAAAAVAVVMMGEGAHAFTVMGTFESDEMGYRTSNTGWGSTSCTESGRYFAPPRSTTQQTSYQESFPSSNIVDGWAGVQYRPEGDSPKYYIVEGRFKDCLYDGYPFGNTSSYWVGDDVVQAAGDVKWSSNSLTSVPTGSTSSIHCVSYLCNNQDDCFGNGLNVTGTWPDCSCGGCVANVSGDSCNNFTVGDSSYIANKSLTYGTPETMRATCEEAGLTLFSTTSNQTEWDLLQSFLPASFRFFVDLNDTETRYSWMNSNGDIVSTSRVFNSSFYGAWGGANEGEDGDLGHCVDMVGGLLYQGNCSGNRYFLCAPSFNTDVTTTSPITNNATDNETSWSNMASFSGISSGTSSGSTTPSTTTPTTTTNTTTTNATTTTAAPSKQNGSATMSLLVGTMVTVMAVMGSLLL